MRDKLLSLLIMMTLISTITTVFVLVGLSWTKFPSIYFPIIIGIFLSSMVIYVLFTIKTFAQNYSPFKVSIVGQPNSGKTVYLTVLFETIQYYKNSNVNFFPYGRETIEQISSDLSILHNGKWLKPTSKESLFFYRANAVIGSGLFSKKYTVEIADYAGEYVNEFDSSSESWLHKTDYFKHVVSSDAILFAVDGIILKSGNKTKINEIQNKLIAAFQVMVDEKGVSADRKLRSPVALLILKSDIFDNIVIDERKILGYLKRLIIICETKCYNFKTYFVSSVGKTKLDGSPPEEIKPYNVCEPMIWLLKQGKSK